VVAGNAVAGRFAGPLGDTQVMLQKFTFQPIGFELSHPEFAPDPDKKAPVFDHGLYLPRGAEFRRAGGGIARSGFYLANGNQVVPTVTVFMLADHEGRQYPSAFRFVRTGYKEGRRLGEHAAALKAVVDGETVCGCICGKYLLEALLETGGAHSYYRPKWTLLGVVGEPGGPTVAQYLFDAQLRDAFKAGDDWTAIQPPALPAPVPAKPTLVRTEIEPPPASPDDYSGPASLDEILSDKVPR
jgi:hypothetical protein